MDVCYPITEEGMSTLESGRRDWEKCMRTKIRRRRKKTSRGGTARLSNGIAIGVIAGSGRRRRQRDSKRKEANKQIIDLESKNASLLSELSTSSRSSASSSNGPFLPRTARHTLTSHRSPITRIAFHPTWTVLASASEDSTVKIWDWESGDFERTVKGHTKAVMDVDFDPKGNVMGKWSRTLSVRVVRLREEVRG